MARCDSEGEGVEEESSETAGAVVFDAGIVVGELGQSNFFAAATEEHDLGCLFPGQAADAMRFGDSWSH